MSQKQSSFQIGDVVTLKSGSPAMTVTIVYDDGTVQTSWIMGNEGHGCRWPQAALRPAAQIEL